MDSYRIFKETKQEPQRLRAALKGFFDETDADEEKRREYVIYLKKRIRPAVEVLICEDEIDKMEEAAALGWFGEKEIDYFITIAREKKKTASLVWLLRRKEEQYGYRKKEYPL